MSLSYLFSLSFFPFPCAHHTYALPVPSLRASHGGWVPPQIGQKTLVVQPMAYMVRMVIQQQLAWPGWLGSKSTACMVICSGQELPRGG